MARFLTTTGTNYHVEELIKGAFDRLILISPLLKLNDRMKELLGDKNRLVRHWGQVLPFAPSRFNLPPWHALFALNSPTRFTM